MPTETPFIAIATISIELGVPVDYLTARCGDRVIVDDIGMRCVSRDTAAQIIAEHHARRQAEAEHKARRQAEFQARMTELDRRNRAQRTRGRPAVSGNAYADLIGGTQ